MQSKDSNKQIMVIFVLILVLAWSGCASPGKRTGIGAGAGAGVGAAIGGAAGGWKGAGIGALVGAATGAVVGNYLDKQYNELEQVTDVKRMKDGLLVNLKNDLLFETGSAQLKSEAQQQLGELGTILKKYKQDRIRIAGYTDSVGTASHNEMLSERRADAVRDVLKRSGVEDEQLLTQGFGETRPVASNDSPTGRAKNRRVELIIDVPADKEKEVQNVGPQENERLPASAQGK